MLTDTFGHRLSGSPQLERAIQWAAEEMKRDGLENVRIEPVMVPKWVRGRERADMIQPAQHALVMLGLGDSAGTPPEGVEAEVLLVQSFAELDAKSALGKGGWGCQCSIHELWRLAIVLHERTVARRPSRRRARSHPNEWTAGPRLPHTGVLQYGPEAPKFRGASPPRMRIFCSAWPPRRADGRAAANEGPASKARSSPATSSASCAAASGPTRSWWLGVIWIHGTLAPARATMAAGASSRGRRCV